jgi:hypothetical protein
MDLEALCKQHAEAT